MTFSNSEQRRNQSRLAGSTSNSREVVAAVVERGGLVLIGRRPEEKLFGGQWEFPGGKIELGETQQEALRRELWEELNVSVVYAESTAHFSVQEPLAHAIIHYVFTLIEGTEQALEHQELAWVPIADLLNYDLAPSDRAYAEFRIRAHYPEGRSRAE